MSVDLRGEEEVVSLGSSLWGFCLRLAEAYGWTPAGTSRPGAHRWSGAYDTNDGQVVAREDAVAFASALERALADPARLAREAEVAGRVAADVAAAFRRATGEDLPEEMAEVVEGNEDTLRTLVRLARAGSFRIE